MALAGSLFRWVEECEIAGQHQGVFIGFRVGGAFLNFLAWRLPARGSHLRSIH